MLNLKLASFKIFFLGDAFSKKCLYTVCAFRKQWLIKRWSPLNSPHLGSTQTWVHAFWHCDFRFELRFTDLAFGAHYLQCQWLYLNACSTNNKYTLTQHKDRAPPPPPSCDHHHVMLDPSPQAEPPSEGWPPHTAEPAWVAKGPSRGFPTTTTQRLHKAVLAS